MPLSRQGHADLGWLVQFRAKQVPSFLGFVPPLQWHLRSSQFLLSPQVELQAPEKEVRTEDKEDDGKGCCLSYAVWRWCKTWENGCVMFECWMYEVKSGVLTVQPRNLWRSIPGL